MFAAVSGGKISILWQVFLTSHCFGLLSVTIKIRVLLKWGCNYKMNIMCVFTVAVSIRCISTWFGTGNSSLPNGNFSVCLHQCFLIPVLCDWFISIIFLQFIFSPAKPNPNSCMFSSYNGGRICAGRISAACKTHYNV